MSPYRHHEPDDMVTIMLSQFLTAPPGKETCEERLRRALAAVLPEHEKQVRERIAEAIDAELADPDSDYERGLDVAASIARGES